MPPALEAPGETVVATLHAEGAQVYECKAGADGKLAWAFREPIATLLLDGKTVGRHYAGPNWEHTDGSAIVGKVVANAPGKTAGDIAWLKLEVTARRGSGTLSGVTTVQRINTAGRRACRRLRQGGRLPQRALRHRLRLPAQRLVARSQLACLAGLRETRAFLLAQFGEAPRHRLLGETEAFEQAGAELQARLDRLRDDADRAELEQPRGMGGVERAGEHRGVRTPRRGSPPPCARRRAAHRP